MRIAVDARPLSTGPNGISRYLQSILSNLGDTGHEWYLYSDRGIVREPGLPGARLREGTMSRRWSSTAFAQVVFPRWSKRDLIDVFWSPRHHLPLALSNASTVVTIHDLVWRMAPETMIPLGRMIERLLMPPAIARADAIITPSHATARDIVSAFHDAAPKITTIPLAAELPRANAAPVCPPYMLFVGTVEPRKNLERVLLAFERLIEAGVTSHRLVVAGQPGWKQETVLARLQSLQQAGRVVFWPEPDDQTLANLYAGADFLVAPSLYEGFGLQVAEARSFGKPVVTSQISSMPEVADGAGILVDPLSVDEIFEAMRTLIDDRITYQALSANTRTAESSSSWADCARRTLEVIEHTGRQCA